MTRPKLTNRRRRMCSYKAPAGLILVGAFASLALVACPRVFGQAGGYANCEGSTNYVTTGGTGGTTTTVTTVSAFASAVGSASPMVILFSNTLNIGDFSSSFRNNKTIIGLGTSATLNGDLRLFRATNVIFRNVFFTNPSEVGSADGITMQFSQHVWIDHCTFSDTGDGAWDMTHACDFTTSSYNMFYYTTNTGHNFPNLIGHSDTNTAEDSGRLHITFHHTWWSTMCRERMPRVRFGRVHLFNNYYNCSVSNAIFNNYCVGASISSEVLVVKNVFERVDQPARYQTPAGLLSTVSNAYINCTGVVNFNDTVFTPPYSFTMDETNLVAGIVTNNAGAGRVPVPAFTASTTNGAAPLTVTFTDTSTGFVTDRFWNFGDGNTTNLTNNTVTHIYNAGTYSVTLTPSGPPGSNTLTRSNYIVATGGTPPVADFTATPTNSTAPLLVNFTDISTGSITNRYWDFGDGNTTNFAALTNPTHTYTPGVFTVSLTVSGTGGDSNLTRTALIIALDPFQAWQLQYFSCTNCAQADAANDADGDGMNNTNEFLAGTSPTNAASVFQIISTAQQGDDIAITWMSGGGHTNTVQAASGDGDGSYETNFFDISAPIALPGSGDVTTNYLDTGGVTNVPSRYYRIRLVP